MQMKTKLATAMTAAAFAFVLSGCSSLPEGSKKPMLEISSVEVAQDRGESGFNVCFKVRHDSLKPLEVRKIETSVSVNGVQVSNVEEEPDELLLPPRREITLQRFIPANLARSVSGSSLKTPMFFGTADCGIKMHFTSDEEDAFNPSASFHGMLNNGGTLDRSND